MNATVVIQSTVRQRQAKAVMEDKKILKHRHCAARKIQSRQRGRTARLTAERERRRQSAEHRRVQLEYFYQQAEEASKVVQRNVRANLVRRKLKRDGCSAIVIQSVLRGRILRKLHAQRMLAVRTIFANRPNHFFILQSGGETGQASRC